MFYCSYWLQTMESRVYCGGGLMNIMQARGFKWWGWFEAVNVVVRSILYAEYIMFIYIFVFGQQRCECEYGWTKLHGEICMHINRTLFINLAIVCACFLNPHRFDVCDGLGGSFGERSPQSRSSNLRQRTWTENDALRTATGTRAWSWAGTWDRRRRRRCRRCRRRFAPPGKLSAFLSGINLSTIVKEEKHKQSAKNSRGVQGFQAV